MRRPKQLRQKNESDDCAKRLPRNRLARKNKCEWTIDVLLGTRCQESRMWLMKTWCEGLSLRDKSPSVKDDMIITMEEEMKEKSGEVRLLLASEARLWVRIATGLLHSVRATETGIVEETTSDETMIGICAETGLRQTGTEKKTFEGSETKADGVIGICDLVMTMSLRGGETTDHLLRGTIG